MKKHDFQSICYVRVLVGDRWWRNECDAVLKQQSLALGSGWILDRSDWFIDLPASVLNWILLSDFIDRSNKKINKKIKQNHRIFTHITR